MSARHLVLVGMLGTALAGCAENRSSFFVQQVQSMGEDCEVSGDEGSAFHTYGVLDVGFAWQYEIHPLLRNQMTANANAANLVTESNGIQVEGANIRIWRGGRPQGSAFYTFYQPAVSYVAPSSTGVSGFVAIPRQAIAALLQFTLGVDDANQLTFQQMLGYRDLITIGVTMLGTTTGGREVETPEFYFPIHLCFGCSVICPTSSADTDTGVLCESNEEPEAFGCNALLGQDSPVDCRWCSTAFGPDEGPALCRQYFCGLSN